MNNGLAHPANIGGGNYFVWASDYAGYSAHCSTSIVPRDESVSVTSGPVPARQSTPPPLAGPPRSAGGWRRMIAFARGASTEIRNYRRNSAHLQSGRRRSAPDNACRKLRPATRQRAVSARCGMPSSENFVSESRRVPVRVLHPQVSCCCRSQYRPAEYSSPPLEHLQFDTSRRHSPP